jgi:dTDP-4-dehydrorhamnose 3,5-epimerase-like enzyme
MINSLLSFSVIGDARGNLVSLEELNNIPFPIKRVYYLYDLQKDLPRGFHAHKELQQVLICLKGSCNVVLDDGVNTREFHLDQPHIGQFVDRMIWHEMEDFTNDCVLMVLASNYYDENDYIRNYYEFLNLK